LRTTTTIPSPITGLRSICRERWRRPIQFTTASRDTQQCAASWPAASPHLRDESRQVVPRSGDEIEIRDRSRSGVVADVHVWLRVVVAAEPDEIVTPDGWPREDDPWGGRSGGCQRLKLVEFLCRKRLLEHERRLRLGCCGLAASPSPSVEQRRPLMLLRARKTALAAYPLPLRAISESDGGVTHDACSSSQARVSGTRAETLARRPMHQQQAPLRRCSCQGPVHRPGGCARQRLPVGCLVNVHTRREDADAVLNILRELGEAQRRTPKTVV
jgi:hypothetical protein